MKEVIIKNQSLYRLSSGGITLERGSNRLTETQWKTFQEEAVGLARQYLNDESVVASKALPYDLNALSDKQAKELINECTDPTALKRWYLNSDDDKKYVRWLICERVAYVPGFEWSFGEYRWNELHWSPDELERDPDRWNKHNRRLFEQQQAREARARKINEFERKLDLGLI